MARSLSRIGEVKFRQDIPGALAAYEENLGIMRRLAETDSTNAAWQRGLAISLRKQGQIKQFSGEFEEASAADEESVAILRHLVAIHPASTQGQRDLAMVLADIGLAKIAETNGTAAVAAYEEGLAINAAWPRQIKATPFGRRIYRGFWGRLSGHAADGGRERGVQVGGPAGVSGGRPLWADDVRAAARAACARRDGGAGARVPHAVCADESAESMEMLERIIALGSAAIINIKIQRVGGIGHARRMHDRAREAGLARAGRGPCRNWGWPLWKRCTWRPFRVSSIPPMPGRSGPGRLAASWLVVVDTRPILTVDFGVLRLRYAPYGMRGTVL